jgi:hypothetical protein
LVAAPALSHAMNCRGGRWANCYEKLRLAVEEQRAEDAASLVEDLLAAGHDDESEAKLVTGVNFAEYYVYYYQAQALLRLGSIDAARAAAERTLHPGRAELLARIEPPRLQVAEPELVESRFQPPGAEAVEHAVVRVRGTVFDSNGLESIKARDVVGDDLRFESDGQGFHFEGTVTVDAARGRFELVATDTTGLTASQTVEVPLTQLDLGRSAGLIHAVLVGVDAYDKRGWWSDERADCLSELRQRCPAEFSCYPIPDLQAASNDARRFADLLRRRGVPDANVRLLTTGEGGTQPTKENIARAVDEILGAAGRTVIFFFAGHGLHASGENLLLPADTRGWECNGRRDAAEQDLPGSAIRVSEIRDKLRDSAFAERYLILDACRTPPEASRSVGKESMELPAFRGSRLVGVGAKEREPVTIYGTQDSKVSVEWKSQGSGYFTWYLLQALRQDLSLAEIEAFVQEEVRKRTALDLCGRPENCPEAAEGGGPCEIPPDCLEIQVPVFEWPKEFEDLRQRRQTYIMRSSQAPTAPPR